MSDVECSYAAIPREESLEALTRSLRAELEEMEAQVCLLESKIRNKREQLMLLAQVAGSSSEVSEWPLSTSDDAATEPADSDTSLDQHESQLGACDNGGAGRPILLEPVQSQPLSTRSLNCLRSAGIETVADLVRSTPEDLLSVRAFGAKCFDEVTTFLSSHGLALGTHIEAPPPGLHVAVMHSELTESRGTDDLIGEGRPASVPPGADDIIGSVGDRLPAEVRDHIGEAMVGARRVSEPTATSLRGLLRLPIAEASQRYRLDPGAILRHTGLLIELFRRIAVGQRITFLDEVRVAIARANPDDVPFAVGYLALDGGTAATLEEVGARFSVTRERARQRVARFRTEMLKVCPPLPLCDETIRALADAESPVGLAEWRARLPDIIRPESDAALRVLRELESWGWLAPATWHLEGPVELVAHGADREGEIESLLDRYSGVTRQYLRFGAVPLLDLAASLGGTVDSARTLVRADPRWTDGGYDWLIRTDASGTRIVRQARRMITVLGPLSPAQVRYGLSRLGRHPKPGQPTVLPPVRVLRRILVQSGFIYDRATQQLSLGDQRARVDAPRGISAAVIAAFGDSPGAITVHELDMAVAEHGLSRASSRVATLRSPFLRRECYGVYSLLGHPPAPTEITDATARLRGEAASALLRQHAEGRDLLLEYDPARVGSSGVLYVPPGLIETGSWHFRDSDGLGRRLRVGEYYIGRAGRLLREMRSHADAPLLLRFVHEGRRVELVRTPRLAYIDQRDSILKVVPDLRVELPDIAGEDR